MHAAVEAGVHGLQLLYPLQLRAPPTLLLLGLGVETLVPAAQHRLQVAAYRVLILVLVVLYLISICSIYKIDHFILKDTWHTICFLQELTISYSPQCLFATYWQQIWKIKCKLLKDSRGRIECAAELMEQINHNDKKTEAISFTTYGCTYYH